MNAISDPVRAQAEARPGAPAVVTEAAVWTWADLDARVGACAERLATLVTGRRLEVPGPLGGAAVAGVVAQTQPDLVVLLLAALRARIVAAPLSPRWPATVIRDAVERLGVTLVASDAPIDGLETLRLSDLAAPHVPTSHIPHPASPRRPWTVVHTSGSSGAPKAVLHTVGNHVASASGVSKRVGLRSGDTWLLDLPLAHVGGIGIVVRCALAGAAMAIPERSTSTAEALRRFAPTHASLVSTHLVRLLRDAPGESFPSLRAVLLGGSAIPPGLLDAAVAAGLPVSVGYGMTEATSTVTATAPGASRRDLGTSGTVLPGREVQVSDAGEIEVRGETLFAGYVDRERLVRPLTPDGWFATGDLGRLDAEGRLVVEGRRDNRFVSGGENVQPEAVEAALTRLPGVAEAIVVPVEDAEFGARPVAFVRPSGASVPAAEALRAGLREMLPGFAVPVAFFPWDGPAGIKPDRKALTETAGLRFGV